MSSARRTYREYAPARPLGPFVACYWSSTAPAGVHSHRVLPDGCIDILFDLSGDLYSQGTVIGTMTRPLLFETSSPMHMIAVRFRPGGAVPFLRLAAHEITDSQAALADVWQPDCLTEQLCDEADDRRRVQRLESMLLARLSKCPKLDRRIQAAVSRLDDPGTSIDDVATAVNMSRQHLVRLFRQHVGVSPKQFARVSRIQRLRSRIRHTAQIDWLSLALDTGFYDQAHMITECRTLTGMTPTQMAKR